jgi:hypothetical protein
MSIPQKYLVKFDRFCAWFLVALFVAFFISGFGETKGIISTQLAKYLHETILPVPGAIAFAFHSAYGMHVAIKRWKRWGPIPRTLLILYAAAIIIGILIFQYVVEVPGSVAVPQKIDL